MKKLLVFLLVSLAARPGQCQTPAATLPDSVRAFLDKSLTLLETHSLERKAVDWPRLRQAAYQKAQSAQTIGQLLPVYPFIFEQIKDDHGWLTYQGSSFKWTNPARPKYANVAVRAALAKKPGIVVKVLPGQIGYILLPGINAGGSLAQQRAAAQLVRDSVCRISSDQIKGWIIDLRLNSGGAMAPMLAGLAPLIGDGHLGGFVDKDGQPQEQWTLRGGNFLLDTLKITNVPSRCPLKRTNLPIAVLQSGMTASSGEIVAISLKGRPATRFFGEPTYGATTANESFAISRGAYLTIAGTLDADRRGTAYKQAIPPDELVTGPDNFLDPAQDAKMQAALKWLKTAKPGKVPGKPAKS